MQDFLCCFLNYFNYFSTPKIISNRNCALHNCIFPQLNSQSASTKMSSRVQLNQLQQSQHQSKMKIHECLWLLWKDVKWTQFLPPSEVENCKQCLQLFSNKIHACEIPTKENNAEVKKCAFFVSDQPKKPHSTWIREKMEMSYRKIWMYNCTVCIESSTGRKMLRKAKKGTLCKHKKYETKKYEFLISVSFFFISLI